MAIEINDNLNVKKVIQLLNKNFVISKKKYRYDNKTKTIIQDRNIIQIIKEYKNINIIMFDFFGNKQTEIKKVSLSDLKKYLYLGSKEKWFKHKKRTSKKIIDKNILNEEDCKKIVYKWLLNRYENEIIVPEISLSDRRVDYIVFGKNIVSIEIKSEIDTLDRLEEQLKVYEKYSNYIYIAIHSNKLKKLSTLNISKNIGIIELNNQNKLKVIKRAVKIKNDYNSLIGKVSYEEFINMKKGFKGSSLISKEDTEILFYKLFTKKEKNNYLFNIWESRYKYESNLRKKLWSEGKFSKSVNNSKGIGINRFTLNNNQVSLKYFFNLNENYLKEKINKIKSKTENDFKSFKYKDILINDKLFYLYILKLLNIQYTTDSSIINKYINLQKNKIIINKQIKFITNNINNKIIEFINNISENKNNLIEVRTKEMQNLIIDILDKEKYTYKVIKDINNGDNKILFKDTKNLIILNKNHKFYFFKDINKITLF